MEEEDVDALCLRCKAKTLDQCTSLYPLLPAINPKGALRKGLIKRRKGEEALDQKNNDEAIRNSKAIPWRRSCKCWLKW